jgi:hypothetical protein
MPHVFLSGNQRSGKTLAQLILCSHPDITISPGTKVIGKLLYAMPGKVPLDGESVRDIRATMQKDRKFKAWRVDHAKFLDGFDRYVGQSPHVVAADLMTFFRDQTKPNAKYVGNKKGCYCKEGDLIGKIFPGCRLVYLLRDGRGAVASMLETQPEHDVYSAALTWTLKAQRIRELSAKLPRDVFVLRYEELVGDPEKLSRALCTFLDVPYAKEMLADYKTNDAIRHTTDTTHAETYQAITTKFVDEWKDKLTREQLEIVEGIAGAELEANGYGRSMSKSSNLASRAKWRAMRTKNYADWWLSHQRKERRIGA